MVLGEISLQIDLESVLSEFFAHFEICWWSSFVFSKNKIWIISDTFLAQISLVFCTAEIAIFPYLCYSGSIANFQAKKSKIYFFEINRFF